MYVHEAFGKSLAAHRGLKVVKKHGKYIGTFCLSKSEKLSILSHTNSKWTRNSLEAPIVYSFYSLGIINQWFFKYDIKVKSHQNGLTTLAWA